MRSPIRRVALAVAVAAAALAAPAAAGAKLLDDYYNEGIEPHADLGASRPANHPSQLRVEFSGSAPPLINGRDTLINGSYTVKCKVGGATKFSRKGTVSGVSPINAVVPIKRRFDSCRVTGAEARYEDPFITGWLRIRVFAR